MTKRHKEYVALAACCLAIFWPGASLFGFPGVMGPYWQRVFGVGKADVGQTLFFMLAAVGIFMFFVGWWKEKIGSSAMAYLGAIMCGFITIWVGRISNFTHVYVWAFLAGVVSCLIYLPGITVVQQWFPDRRGLVSGLFNMSFAASGAVLAPVFTLMLDRFGYGPTTVYLGIAALITGLCAAPFVRAPGIMETQSHVQKTEGIGSGLTVAQSLNDGNFWLLWNTWALSGAAGIAMVTNSMAFGMARGLATHEAVIILMAFNLTSGCSRVVSGYLSDVFGRNIIMSSACAGAGVAYLLMPHMGDLAIWSVLAGFVGFAFGTMWAVSAPLASDCFGLRHFAAIFGLLYTAYGFVAGPLGPWLSGCLLDITQGNFRLVFGYLAAFQLTSAVLIWFVRPISQDAAKA
jgi:OFA family oxalate/formate antiporter-like MFS transporter